MPGAEEALDAECARVRAVCSSMLLDAQAGHLAEPAGVDHDAARRRRCPLACGAVSTPTPWPPRFLSPRPSCRANSGVLYGTAAKGSGLVLWDRFAQDNHNSVILARSGAGKSYLAKLEALRSLYAGIEVAVVDPEDEYRRLADAVGGAYLHLGAPGGAARTPSTSTPGPERSGAPGAVHPHLGRRPGWPNRSTPRPSAVLDRAILAAYDSVGITSDPRTHARPAPVLADLARPSRPRTRSGTAGPPPGPLRDRHPSRALRWSDHDPARGPSGRLLACEICPTS